MEHLAQPQGPKGNGRLSKRWWIILKVELLHVTRVCFFKGSLVQCKHFAIILHAMSQFLHLWKGDIYYHIESLGGAKYANCRATSITWYQFQKLIRNYLVFTLFNSKHQDCFNLFIHHLPYHQSWILSYSTWHVFYTIVP